MTRILQAQSQVTIARSQESPTVDGSASAPYAGYTGSDRPITLPDNSFAPQAGLGVAWELDFWGRFRRNTEAAQAELLASEDARFVVMATLVAEVGQAYLTLRALDLTLEISRRTVDLADAVARPRPGAARRRRGGDTRSASGRDAALRRDEDDPRDPAPDRADREFHQHPARTESGAGQARAPARRADRRPDAAAGPAVGSAHAAAGRPQGGAATGCGERPDRRRQGVALSQITISGFAGAGGATIDGSSFGPFGIFSALPSITLPIFNAGRLQANVEYNEARAQEAVLRYQQTLQQAFREVADALVDIRKRQEFRQQQELLVGALADASQVANLRYEGGVSSYLEVLDTERQLFDAELQLVQAKRDESVSVIQLYKALGGGWQAESAKIAATGSERSPSK